MCKVLFSLYRAFYHVCTLTAKQGNFNENLLHLNLVYNGHLSVDMCCQNNYLQLNFFPLICTFYIQNERVFLLNAFSTVPFCGEIVHFWRIKHRSPKTTSSVFDNITQRLYIQLSWCAMTSHTAQNYLEQTPI